METVEALCHLRRDVDGETDAVETFAVGRVVGFAVQLCAVVGAGNAQG
jgi:hypothetical protein